MWYFIRTGRYLCLTFIFCGFSDTFANVKLITCCSSIFSPIPLSSPSRQPLMHGKQDFCHCWDQTFLSPWLRLTLSSMESTPKGFRELGIRKCYWNPSACFGRAALPSANLTVPPEWAYCMPVTRCGICESRLQLERNCRGEEVGFFLEGQSKKLNVSGYKLHQGKI